MPDQQTKLLSVKPMGLNSECQIEFIYSKQEDKIIPVLMLTGVKTMNGQPDRIWSSEADAHIGIIDAGYDNESKSTFVKISGDNNGAPIKINPYLDRDNPGDWLIIHEDEIAQDKYQIVYPRVLINSLGLRTNAENLVLKYVDIKNTANNLLLMKPYKDYTILTRAINSQYALTLNNNLILKNNLELSLENNLSYINFLTQLLRVDYSISNADTSIYLDALQVAYQNSRPKVSYEVQIQPTKTLKPSDNFHLIRQLVRINDNDLKFNNVKGYVSALTLDLDSPDEDTIEIKNYKTKFEDLFTTITAQTEEMKKNNFTLQNIASAFTPTGELTEQVLQTSIKKVDLNYAFNNGKLTIDDKNGIWGISDTGVVAFRGGGIFTATEKNADDTWKWNTGITPQGINADLITSGQLDTNLIKIYAGDHLKFQMNGDGIFAYKSIISDASEQEHPLKQGELDPKDSIDSKQYVVFNDEGLALIAQKGAKVLKNNKQDYFTVLDQQYIYQPGKHRQNLANIDKITRVEVSWNGFILRNWDNERVFYADPETGNLTITGHINASSGHIGTWNFNDARLWADSQFDSETNTYKTFVAINAGGSSTVNETMVKADGSLYMDPQNTKSPLYVRTGQFAFWAGSVNPEIAPFSIKKNGVIRAASGNIGGWTIQANGLESTMVSLSTIARKVEASEKDNKNVITTNGKTSYAMFWVHDSADDSDPNKAKMYINSSGEVFARNCY